MLNRIIGHDLIKKNLLTMKGNIPLVFIFSGLKGVGKEHTALHYIDELYSGSLCDNIYEHPDIQIFYSENNVFKVENIHNIKKDFLDTPLELDKKFYILKGADLMTKQAANACLKMLEESPSFNHFFLLVENHANLINTISSRGVLFNFYPLSNIQALYSLSEKEITLLKGCLGRMPLLKDPLYLDIESNIKHLLENIRNISYAEIFLYLKNIKDLDFFYLIDILQFVLLEGRKNGKYLDFFQNFNNEARLFKEKLHYNVLGKNHFIQMFLNVKSNIK